MHYQRRRRGQAANAFDLIAFGRELARSMPCVAHGCPHPVTNAKRGVCHIHYQRVLKGGSYANRGRQHLRQERYTVTEKKCGKCGEVKSAKSFSPAKKNVDGLKGACITCNGVYNRDRNYRIRTKYGMSNDDYLEMVIAQSALCAICGVQAEANGLHSRLYIDHDHRSGAVRGLLCHGCNVGIGWMADDPDRLDAAAAYLRRA